MNAGACLSSHRGTVSSQPSYLILQPCTAGGGTQLVDRKVRAGGRLGALGSDTFGGTAVLGWGRHRSLLGYWLSTHTLRPWAGTLCGWGGSQGVSSVTMAAPLLNLAVSLNLAVCRSPKTRVGHSSCCPAALVGRLRPEVHTWHVTYCSLGLLGPDQVPGRGRRWEWRTKE